MSTTIVATEQADAQSFKTAVRHFVQRTRAAPCAVGWLTGLFTVVTDQLCVFACVTIRPLPRVGACRSPSPLTAVPVYGRCSPHLPNPYVLPPGLPPPAPHGFFLPPKGPVRQGVGYC